MNVEINFTCHFLNPFLVLRLWLCFGRSDDHRVLEGTIFGLQLVPREADALSSWIQHNRLEWRHLRRWEEDETFSSKQLLAVVVQEQRNGSWSYEFTVCHNRSEVDALRQWLVLVHAFLYCNPVVWCDNRCAGRQSLKQFMGNRSAWWHREMSASVVEHCRSTHMQLFENLIEFCLCIGSNHRERSFLWSMMNFPLIGHDSEDNFHSIFEFLLLAGQLDLLSRFRNIKSSVLGANVLNLQCVIAEVEFGMFTTDRSIIFELHICSNSAEYCFVLQEDDPVCNFTNKLKFNSEIDVGTNRILLTCICMCDEPHFYNYQQVSTTEIPENSTETNAHDNNVKSTEQFRRSSTVHQRHLPVQFQQISSRQVQVLKDFFNIKLDMLRLINLRVLQNVSAQLTKQISNSTCRSVFAVRSLSSTLPRLEKEE